MIMNMIRKKTLWTLCCASVILLTILALSPAVIPTGRHTPMLAGLPYTLWTGILVSVLLVLITWVGTRVHPGETEEQKNRRTEEVEFL